MPLTPSTRLGPYEIIAPLGAGGMGEVYRARDTRLKRDVAIKVLPDDVAASPERLARFEREAITVAGLNHPNIVVLHSIEEAEGTPAGAHGLLFLPYLAGERAPIWDSRASGAFFGIRNSHTRAHFTRAILEGVAFSLRQIAELTWSVSQRTAAAVR